MEEIITLDGRQFRLTTDRPLTATEKTQVIADIRKQSGCGTCGPRVANLGNDWQYGGMKSLADASCPSAATKYGSGASTGTIHLKAAPRQGIQPYTVEFLKAPANSTATDGGDAVTIDFATRLSGQYHKFSTGTTVATTGNPQTDVNEAGTDTDAMIDQTYILDDTDVAGATVKTGDAANGASIIFKVTVTDSCPSASGGAQTCSQICRIYVTCIPPTCNFIVT